MAPVLDPDARRTMIAALVPDAESLVGPFRERLDPTARHGLGAHLTLVYPFVDPPRVTDVTVAALREAVAPLAPFRCRFGAVRWFGRRVLWLAPDDPEPFREVAARIVAGVDDLPPREDRELVPHLTVGLRRAAPAAALEQAADALAPALPLTTRIDRVHLMVRAATWRAAVAAPLCG